MLKTLLIAAFLNGLVWIILTPIWQYPDEQSHFAQVQNIAEKSRIIGYSRNTSYEIALSEEIMETSRDSLGNNQFTYHPENKIEYSTTITGLRENEITSLPKTSRLELVKTEATSNPPLYYVLAAFVYKIFYNSNLFTRIILIRVFSLSIFMGLIFLCYQMGNIIFKNKLLSITISSIIAFTPMLVYVSTGILPDTLTNFFFAIIIFFSLKILNETFNKRDVPILITTLFAGLITRQQFYISTLIIIFPILLVILKRKNIIKPFIFLMISIASFLYIAYPLINSIPLFKYFRIADFYIFIDTKISFNSFANFAALSCKRTFSETMPWFWGIYKWLSLSLPPVYYQIINRIVFIAIFGFLIKLFYVIKKKKYDQLKILLFLLWAPFIYFITLMIWNYFFFTKNGYSFGIQGRYYFPIIIPIFAILLIGINNLSKLILKSFSKFILFILTCIMLVFNTATLFHVSASFYDFSSLQTFIIQASQYKPIFFKGNIIILIIIIAIFTQIIYLIKLFKFAINNNENL